MKYYTGVGSRETPIPILSLMQQIATKLASEDYVLRSGGAEGADSAFEHGAKWQDVGCSVPEELKEIYLPWKGFGGSNSTLYTFTPEAVSIAKRIHPAWDKLKLGAKKLHTRNVYQVLGSDCKTPSDFLICWTPQGKDVGGTRTAIVLAREHNIPIWNLANIRDESVLSLAVRLSNLRLGDTLVKAGT